MNINITELKLNKHSSSIEWVISDGKTRASVYVAIDECKRLLSEKWVTYEDCSQIIMFNPHGARIVALNHYSSECQNDKISGSYKETWYTFPRNEVESVLQAFITAPDNSTIDFTDVIPVWVNLYGPQVEWVYNEGVESAFSLDMDSMFVDWGEYGKQNYIAHLTRIAENSSNGNLVKVYLSFDCWNNPVGHPHNYYFDIMDDLTGRRIMDGGIIAHYNEPSNTYQYQMHT
jgi:hypothetical protein